MQATAVLLAIPFHRHQGWCVSFVGPQPASARISPPYGFLANQNSGARRPSAALRPRGAALLSDPPFIPAMNRNQQEKSSCNSSQNTSPPPAAVSASSATSSVTSSGGDARLEDRHQDPVLRRHRILVRDRLEPTIACAGPHRRPLFNAKGAGRPTLGGSPSPSFAAPIGPVGSKQGFWPS